MHRHTGGKSIASLTHSFLMLALLVVISSLSLLPRALCENEHEVADRSKTATPTNRGGGEESMGKGIAGDFILDNFRPSLEMKEKVDFLLTPVCLVQEAISDDVVLTYPGE